LTRCYSSWSKVTQEIISNGCEIETIAYRHTNQNDDYSFITKSHRGWLISLTGVGKYDKLIARYGKNTIQRNNLTHNIHNIARPLTGAIKQKPKPNRVKELFEITDTVNWSNINKLEIQTQDSMPENDRQNIIKGTRNTYNKNMKVVFQ